MNKQASTIRQRIVSSIRRAIIEGSYKPGERLPTRIQLEKQFRTSPVTVQRAMDQLAREGFIEVQQRKAGTIVSRYPPHLHHYRFILPFPLDAREMLSPFVQAVQREAARLEANESGMVCSFCGLSNGLKPDAISQLLNDVRTQRVAGLIFLCDPSYFANSPILYHPGVPRVAISADTGLPNICHVRLDIADVIPRALAHLRGRGCRRISALLNSRANVELEMKRLQAEARAHHIHIPQRWCLPVDWTHPLCAANCVRLLLHPSQAERPDGILITHDALLPATIKALQALDTESHPELVAHANFPSGIERTVPVTLIGFDIADLVSRCIRAIDAIRRGEKVPRLDTVPALFEHELSAAERQQRIECPPGIPAPAEDPPAASATPKPPSQFGPAPG